MKTYLFLIILDFIQSAFCTQDFNITDYDLNSVCPVRWFRRKRATEYTRWRANPVTTNEFIVKVLDEDLTTKPIVAVNIQSQPRVEDKIIIGGVEVPSPITSTTENLRDYTRFVPPTTIAVSRVEGELNIAPVNPSGLTTNLVPFLPKSSFTIRNLERDDSPPASPQFLARTPLLLPRQYAPVAPVAFNPRLSQAPLTPPTVNPYVRNAWEAAIKTSALTRTSPQSNIDLPSRTKMESDNLSEIRTHHHDQGLMFVTRTTSTPERTSHDSKFSNTIDLDDDNLPRPTPLKYFEEIRRREEIKKMAEKDPELSYNMVFYNDEDLPSGTTKDGQDLNESDYDKKRRLKEKDDITDMQELKDEDYDIEHKNESYIKDLYVYEPESEVAAKRGSILGIPGSGLESLKASNDRDKRGHFCSLVKLRPLNFKAPSTLPEIIVQMQHWAETSPLAKWVDITNGNYTTMENPIYMMIVDDPSSGQILSAKQTVMVVAGIQGRDHQAVAAAMYLLYQLIERSESHPDLLTKYRFWVIPVFNPDGYDYSMTFPQRRQWKKNLRQVWDLSKGRESCKACETNGLRCTIQPCYGVNLDRNFEYQWIPAEELRAEHPCGTLYAGKRQLSEAETRALTQYLHDQRTPLATFIAFKEGDVLRQRASRAAAAASSISNSPYLAGQTSEFLSLYAGGIEDWVDGHLGIDNTYTIMMFRPTDAYSSKLRTERVVHEAYAAAETLLLQSLEPLGPPPVVTLTRVKSRSSRISITQLSVITLLLVLWNG